MADVKKYVWAIPVIAGILAIVSLLTPVASMNYMGILSANLWMWDLYTHNFTGFSSSTEFITEPMVMIPSLIATSLIFIGGVGCLASGFILRKNDELRKGIIPSALMGTLFIVGEFLWLILVPLNFPIEDYFPPLLPGMSLTFWNLSYSGLNINLHTVGFGLIGGFLAAGLAYGGAGAARYYSKEREVIVPEKKEIIPPTKEPTASETPELKFCPECGAEIEDPDIKFCGKCGFVLKPPELAPL